MISRVRTHARKLLRKRSTLEPELIRFCADPLVNSSHPHRTGAAAS